MHDNVANLFPTTPRQPRIAFVGEAPAAREVELGQPFVGPSGYFLWESLKKIGLSKFEVFVGNICQHRAPKDKIKFLRWEHPHIQDGLAALRADLTRFDPDIVVALGGHPLRALTGEPHSIEAWKGTLFWSDLLTPRRVKCLAMFHPAAILRNDGYRFFWWHQLNRLEEEMNKLELELPRREIIIYTDFWKAADMLHSCHGKRLAWDIEGYATSGVSCMSFSPSPWEAHVIPFRKRNHEPIFSGEHESRLWEEFAVLVASYNSYEPYHALTKAYAATSDRSRWVSPTEGASNWRQYLHEQRTRPGLLTWNGLYDAFVLAYRHSINPVHAIVDDGMVMYWELFSEVDKSLADATSWLTREPYYKAERKSKVDEEFWTYNGKDTCVTFECVDNLLQREELDACALQHYWFNMSLLPPILYMELRGMKFDDAARRKLLERTQRQIAALQGVLNREVGMPFPASPSALRELVTTTMCVKKPRTYSTVSKVLKSGPRKGTAVEKKVGVPATITTPHDACKFALTPSLEDVHAIRHLLGGDWNNLPRLTAVQRGQLSIHLGCHFNTQSPAANQYLYDTLGLPPQYKIEDGQRTDRLTHDQDALLTLFMAASKHPRWKAAIRPLRVWLHLSRALTATETLVKGPDKDLRMKCSYNHVGPGTGRFSCATSACGVGYNLQTVTKAHRFMFQADEGHEMGQWDLKGADGWTIACHCAHFGDMAMLEDFAAKIKPAQAVVLLMDRGEVVNRTPREVVKQWCADLPDNWKYKAAKRVIWGTAYLMGIVKMGEQITSDAYKEEGELLVVEAKDCRKIQAATLARYWGIPKWQEWVKKLVLSAGVLQSASGHRRRFYGRRWEYKEDSLTGTKRLEINRAVHGSALSNEPQEVTTFATKLGLWRMWYDPENREAEDLEGFAQLIVEPLHTVHDSLVDQWPEQVHDFALRKHREWFNNPLTIAGREVVIPVAGEVGKDWGMKGAMKV